MSGASLLFLGDIVSDFLVLIVFLLSPPQYSQSLKCVVLSCVVDVFTGVEHSKTSCSLQFDHWGLSIMVVGIS